MNKKQKKMLIRIVIAAVLVVAFSLIPMKGYVKFVLFMIPYLVIGYDILKKAGKGILNRQMFDENFLMAVATITTKSALEYTVFASRVAVRYNSFSSRYFSIYSS